VAGLAVAIDVANGAPSAPGATSKGAWAAIALIFGVMGGTILSRSRSNKAAPAIASDASEPMRQLGLVNHLGLNAGRRLTG
jgi:hypothetical protein